MARLGLIGGLLTNDKAPYMVTLFIAALTWVVHRTTERLAGAPFVEYRISASENEKGTKGVTLRIRNITDTARFDCVLITLKPRASESLKFGAPLEQRHGIRGTALTLLTAEVTRPDEWVVRATNVAPGTDNTLFIPATGVGEPAAMVQPCSEVVEIAAGDTRKAIVDKQESKAAAIPVLVPWGVRPFFVEYELLILWSSLGGWLLLLIPWARELRFAQRTAKPPK